MTSGILTPSAAYPNAVGRSNAQPDKTLESTHRESNGLGEAILGFSNVGTTATIPTPETPYFEATGAFSSLRIDEQALKVPAPTPTVRTETEPPRQADIVTGKKWSGADAYQTTTTAPKTGETSSSDLAFLTVDEAALLLRVNRKTLYDAVRCGSVPGVVRLGRTIRISRQALVESSAGLAGSTLGKQST